MGEQGADIQAYLLKKTGQRTVPSVRAPCFYIMLSSHGNRAQVFINRKHIGGADAVLALQESGKLEKLVAGLVHPSLAERC